MDRCNHDGRRGCNDVPCQQGYMHMLLKALESRIEAEAPTCSLDCVLKPGLQLIVANNLEVSRTSSVTLFELLRRHQPDAARWTNFVGLRIEVDEVDEDDFRAIARSALACRACVLDDALGAKAAEKFAAGHFAPPPHRPPAQTAAPRTGIGGIFGTTQGAELGSDKSFDMFD
jgi:hypothetical protein